MIALLAPLFSMDQSENLHGFDRLRHDGKLIGDIAACLKNFLDVHMRPVGDLPRRQKNRLHLALIRITMKNKFLAKIFG